MGLDLGFVSGCKAVSEDARVALIRKPARCKGEKKWLFLKSFRL